MDQAIYLTFLISNLINYVGFLINQSTNPDVAAKLKDQKNQAILQMAEQQMVPIVRNIPGSYVSIDNNIPALPSPRK